MVGKQGSDREKAVSGQANWGKAEKSGDCLKNNSLWPGREGWWTETHNIVCTIWYKGLNVSIYSVHILESVYIYIYIGCVYIIYIVSIIYTILKYTLYAYIEYICIHIYACISKKRVYILDINTMYIYKVIWNLGKQAKQKWDDQVTQQTSDWCKNEWE